MKIDRLPTRRTKEKSWNVVCRLKEVLYRFGGVKERSLTVDEVNYVRDVWRQTQATRRMADLGRHNVDTEDNWNFKRIMSSSLIRN